MIKRIIEISSSPAEISLKRGQLVLSRDGVDDMTAPIEDIGVLIISHHSVNVSSGAMNEMLKNNVAVIYCDGKHMPSGLLLPFSGHSTQTQSIAAQAAMSAPSKKRLWRSVVKAKIIAQARVLKEAREENGSLLSWAKSVRSGDPENMEARAARFYWPRLFGKEFRRRRDGPAPNPFLNYGYAVLRASVARALVGAGLHPSLGIHHSSKYDDFCLADDLMEPLRPLVDRKVWKIWRDNSHEELDKGVKQALLGILTEALIISDKKEPFMVALQYYAASLRRALGSGEKLDIPEW